MTKRIFAAVTAIWLAAALPVNAAAETTTAETTTTTAETTTAADSSATTTSAETTTTTTATETTTVSTPASTTTSTTCDPLSGMQYTVSENGVCIDIFNWYNESVVTVPETIEGKPVTKIGSRAFQYCYADAVILPDTVTEIGDYAFVGCCYLTAFDVPQACKKIGYSAFSGCDSLASISVPDSVTEIGAYALEDTAFISQNSNDFVMLGDGLLYAYQGQNTAQVTIPDTVKTIGAYAFAEHHELTAVTIPASVERIQDGAFEYCTELAKIDLQGTPGELALGAVANTKWFTESKEDFLTLGSILVAYHGDDTEVTVPEGITAIGNSAFENNPAVAIVRLPESVTEIRKAAFYKCSSLQVLTTGNQVKSIGDAAFFRCTALKYIRVGQALERIGERGFASCDNLTEVHLPDTVTEIGDKAIGWNYDPDADSYKKNDAVTIFANAEPVIAYAEANDIAHEPLPEEENTEPAPIVTTTAGLDDVLKAAKDPNLRGGVIAAGTGGVLVVGALIAWLFRKKK